jgi:allantoin racemase
VANGERGAGLVPKLRSSDRAGAGAEAEVIIPAGGLPMLLFARECPFVIDGAPVLNGIAVVAKAAEMALALKDITQVFVSRRSTYAKAPAEAIKEFLAFR